MADISQMSKDSFHTMLVLDRTIKENRRGESRVTG